jgi:diguanylate cyclase (GGDEF)-like protein
MMDSMEAVRVLLRFFVSMTTLFLGFAFLLKMFGSGTPHTAGLFSLLAPVRPYMDGLAYLAASPAILLSNLVDGYLPVEFRNWFPTTPAAPVLSRVSHWILQIPGINNGTGLRQKILSTDFAALFPGVLDWRLLLVIPLWNMAEVTLSRFADHLERIQKQHRKRDLEESLGRSYQASPGFTPPPIPNPREGLFQKVSRDIQSAVLLKANPLNTESLTRLLTRQAFLDYLSLGLVQARQNQDYLSLLMIDFDDFHALSQQYGAPAGHSVLAQAGMLLKQLSSPKGDAIAARYGNSELAILLHGAPPDAVAAMAETIRQQVGMIRAEGVPDAVMTACIGAYTVRFVPTNGSHGHTEQSLLAKVEALLARARREGGNRVASEALP